MSLPLFYLSWCPLTFTDLGIVDSTHGFNFTVPKNRSDIIGLELCFMPRTEPTKFL